MAVARILMIENDGLANVCREGGDLLGHAVYKHMKHFTTSLCHFLQDNQFSIEQYKNMKSSPLLSSAVPCDLILFCLYKDQTREQINWSELKRLRALKDVPIVVLTDKELDSERKESYRYGADDYMPQSIHFDEILIRLARLLRRTSGIYFAENKQDQLNIGNLTLYRNEQLVSYSGDELAFTPIQFRLLWTLAENHTEVLSKPYLYKTVLERPYSRDDRSLDMHLSRIRKKLMEKGMAAEKLVTVHGKGYRFA